MLISCPNCKSTFAIPAKAIGATGRKLKCTKCAHIWFQDPLNIDAEMQKLFAVATASSTSANTSKTQKTQKIKYSYIAAILIFLIFSGIFVLFSHPEKYDDFSKIVGLSDFNGIRFHDFHVESEIVDNKLNFHLKGSIVNMTDKTVSLPVINIRVFSKGGRVMADDQLTIPKNSLEPYEKLDINPEITKVSGNADKIEISFKNWLESVF